MDIQPVILAGGSGTRLWPLSRSSYPKQFLPFMDGASLLDLTLTRMVAIAANELSKTPIVICNKDNRFFVAEHFRQAGLENASIMLEPCGRNTAPALTMAALHIADQSDDAVMFVTPSDHLINDTASFNKSAVNAIKLASEGHIVTLGISPTGPETGFGYIKMGEAWGASVEVPGYRLDSFVEKPDLPTAQKYLDSNQYLWNAGVFVLKASIWLENIKTYAPEIHSRCVEAFSSSRKESDFYWIDEGAFSCCPADSIDYAVMEKLSRVDSTQPPLVIPLETGWSDLGSWASYWEVQNKDDSGNALKGDALAIDTCNSLLFSSSRLVATVGVKDLIVVETKDAVLISDKNKTQQVSAIVKHLKKHNREEIKTHSKVHRPWGNYDTVDSGDRFIVKRIVVKPGAALSLQMHHHRAEHWVVVKGTARVTRGEDVFLLSENESTYISIGQKHRLENPGTTPLEIIEVQSGSYLEEDDIVRFDDIYNRGNVQ